jgi:hypothetical protein
MPQPQEDAMTPRPSIAVLASPLLAALAACAGSAGPAAAPVQVESLMGRNVDPIGVVVDMPDGQYLGDRATSPTAATPTVYRWDALTQAFDRFSQDYKLSTEDLRAAGLPVLDGDELEFTEGMFRDTRYRLGGELHRLTIGGQADFEVRIGVRWRLFDTQTSSFVLEKETTGYARGGVLGDRGTRPNTLLSAFESALGALVTDPAFPSLGGE